MGLFGPGRPTADHTPAALQERQDAARAEDRQRSVQRANDSTRTNPMTLAQVRAARQS